MRSTWDAMKYLKHGAMYWPTKQPDHWSNGVLILSDRRFAARSWARARPSGCRARYKSFSDAARLWSGSRRLRPHRVTNMHPSHRHFWDVRKWGISLCGLQQKSGGPHRSKLLCPLSTLPHSQSIGLQWMPSTFSDLLDFWMNCQMHDLTLFFENTNH